MKKVLLVSYDFSFSNLRLQPWRYVYEITQRLPTFEYSAAIATDACWEQRDTAGVTIHDTFPLSPFTQNAILKALNDLSPDIILWPVGAKSIAYVPLFRKLKSRIIGYLPGPVLNGTDCLAACRSKLSGESLLAASWIAARILQWGKIMAFCCEKFIVLSKTNRDALINMGIDASRVVMVTAGRDCYEESSEKPVADELSLSGKNHFEDNKMALYMGWPTRVRGMDFLLDAFSIAARQNKNLRLNILARGENTAAHLKLRQKLQEHPARERITLVEGFLPKEEVVKYIAECDFGVLPFIQVPADRPLSFLEFFAAGKPVVSTDASGIPELIARKRGVMANRTNPTELSAALLQMVNMAHNEYEEYREACLTFAQKYPTWEDVVSQFIQIIGEE